MAAGFAFAWTDLASQFLKSSRFSSSDTNLLSQVAWASCSLVLGYLSQLLIHNAERPREEVLGALYLQFVFSRIPLWIYS